MEVWVSEFLRPAYQRAQPTFAETHAFQSFSALIYNPPRLLVDEARCEG